MADELKFEIIGDPTKALEALKQVAESAKEMAANVQASSGVSASALENLQTQTEAPRPVGGAGGTGLEGGVSGLSEAGAGASNLLSQLTGIGEETAVVAEKLSVIPPVAIAAAEAVARIANSFIAAGEGVGPLLESLGAVGEESNAAAEAAGKIELAFASVGPGIEKLLFDLGATNEELAKLGTVGEEAAEALDKTQLAALRVGEGFDKAGASAAAYLEKIGAIESTGGSGAGGGPGGAAGGGGGGEPPGPLYGTAIPTVEDFALVQEKVVVASKAAGEAIIAAGEAEVKYGADSAQAITATQTETEATQKLIAAKQELKAISAAFESAELVTPGVKVEYSTSIPSATEFAEAQKNVADASSAAAVAIQNASEAALQYGANSDEAVAADEAQAAAVENLANARQELLAITAASNVEALTAAQDKFTISLEEGAIPTTRLTQAIENLSSAEFIAQAKAGEVGDQLRILENEAARMGLTFERAGLSVKLFAKAEDEASSSSQRLATAEGEAEVGSQRLNGTLGYLGGRIIGATAGLGQMSYVLGVMGRALAPLNALFTAAFPIIGAILAADILQNLIDKVTKAGDEIRKLSNEFVDLSSSQIASANAIALQNLKLEDQIAKLEGRPATNQLKEALLETAVEADRLAGSLQKDIEKEIELLEKANVSILKSLYTGQSPTSSIFGFTDQFAKTKEALGAYGEQVGKAREAQQDYDVAVLNSSAAAQDAAANALSIQGASKDQMLANVRSQLTDEVSLKQAEGIVLAKVASDNAQKAVDAARDKAKEGASKLRDTLQAGVEKEISRQYGGPDEIHWTTYANTVKSVTEAHKQETTAVDEMVRSLKAQEIIEKQLLINKDLRSTEGKEQKTHAIAAEDKTLTDATIKAQEEAAKAQYTIAKESASRILAESEARIKAETAQERDGGVTKEAAEKDEATKLLDSKQTYFRSLLAAEAENLAQQLDINQKQQDVANRDLTGDAKTARLRVLQQEQINIEALGQEQLLDLASKYDNATLTEQTRITALIIEDRQKRYAEVAKTVQEKSRIEAEDLKRASEVEISQAEEVYKSKLQEQKITEAEGTTTVRESTEARKALFADEVESVNNSFDTRIAKLQQLVSAEEEYKAAAQAAHQPPTTIDSWTNAIDRLKEAIDGAREAQEKFNLKAQETIQAELANYWAKQWQDVKNFTDQSTNALNGFVSEIITSNQRLGLDFYHLTLRMENDFAQMILHMIEKSAAFEKIKAELEKGISAILAPIGLGPASKGAQEGAKKLEEQLKEIALKENSVQLSLNTAALQRLAEQLASGAPTTLGGVPGTPPAATPELVPPVGATPTLAGAEAVTPATEALEPLATSPGVSAADAAFAREQFLRNIGSSQNLGPENLLGAGAGSPGVTATVEAVPTIPVRPGVVPETLPLPASAAAPLPVSPIVGEGLAGGGAPNTAAITQFNSQLQQSGAALTQQTTAVQAGAAAQKIDTATTENSAVTTKLDTASTQNSTIANQINNSAVTQATVSHQVNTVSNNANTVSTAENSVSTAANSAATTVNTGTTTANAAAHTAHSASIFTNIGAMITHTGATIHATAAQIAHAAAVTTSTIAHILHSVIVHISSAAHALHIGAVLADTAALFTHIAAVLKDVIAMIIHAIIALFGGATGGLIQGSGTGTSDSMVMRVSHGEYIVQAQQVNQPGMLGLLHGINAGKIGSEQFASTGNEGSKQESVRGTQGARNTYEENEENKNIKNLQTFSHGGMVKDEEKYGGGGLIHGAGTGTSDSILARVSHGEYIIRAEAVGKPGMLQVLQGINTGRIKMEHYSPKSSAGQSTATSYAVNAIRGFAAGGLVGDVTSSDSTSFNLVPTNNIESTSTLGKSNVSYETNESSSETTVNPMIKFNIGDINALDGDSVAHTLRGYHKEIGKIVEGAVRRGILNPRHMLR